MDAHKEVFKGCLRRTYNNELLFLLGHLRITHSPLPCVYLNSQRKFKLTKILFPFQCSLERGRLGEGAVEEAFFAVFEKNVVAISAWALSPVVNS